MKTRLYFLYSKHTYSCKTREVGLSNFLRVNNGFFTSPVSLSVRLPTKNGANEPLDLSAGNLLD